ncbi:hypothetical protein [Paraburkholderia sp. JHI869]|uniref:hypothetical protein n=1 Tax=Paraburkholderia sp. JHI869 TaxID=3112959 RepID=UPI003178DE7D
MTAGWAPLAPFSARTMRLVINGRDTYPASPTRSNVMPTLLIFLIACFAIIVAMHRGVTRKADAKLRAQFDSQGSGGEATRRLMRNSGYSV